MDFGIATVAAITGICHFVGDVAKASQLNDKWIPVVVGGAGLLLGIAAMYAGMPDFPATDVITAAAVGAVSGFAATGIHQATKQLSKGDE